MSLRRTLRIVVLTASLAIVSGTGVACSDDSGGPGKASGFFTQDERARIFALSPDESPSPVDPTNAVGDDSDAAQLGQFLFFDTRLSADGEQSCATCHQPDHGFSDPKRLSEALGTTSRHAPSLINAAFNRWQFWDGRADSLWAQAVKPLEDPAEQGTTRLDIAHLIARDDTLRQAYEDVFGALPDLSDTTRFRESGRPGDEAWESMSAADQQTINRILTNTTKAIAAYEMKLVSFDSPFDRYVDGLRSGDDEQLSALSEDAKEGLKLFVGPAGCVDCHTGPLLTNFEFHNLGFEPRNWLAPEDFGRYDGVALVRDDLFNAAGEYSDAPESDRARELAFLGQNAETEGQFKTPTLRNVALTAPYMHGGHFETLEEVVRFYSELDESPVLVGHRDETLQQLDLSDEDVHHLVAFLESLTGEPITERLRQSPSSPL
jgi:cytochrome c peroxidase